MNEARQIVSDAIRSRGVPALARESGVHFTRLYAFLKGANLDPDNSGKLRAALVEVPDDVWLALCAPVPGEGVSP